MIYAIECGENGPVKFGFAANPKQRLSELQTGNRERLGMLVCVDLPNSFEKQIHAWLSKHRMRGEWFTRCDDVESVISDLVIRSKLDGNKCFPDNTGYTAMFLNTKVVCEGF